ncbi:MAG: protein kinase [Planctomycetaceae bacterium]
MPVHCHVCDARFEPEVGKPSVCPFCHAPYGAATHETHLTTHGALDRRAQADRAADRDTLPTVAGATPAERGPLGGAPRRFGDYELLVEVARGGMGIVYRARQTKLNRVVALKMIKGGHLATPDEVKRFLTEAESAASLEHPNIVPIYEVGEIADQHFFTMAFVEGESLQDRVAKGPLPERDAGQFVKLVARAVQFAHDKGIVHRDLKPSNVLIETGGQPKVMDFGLAKRVEGDSGLTATGQVIGTPSYMPPEQAGGRSTAVGTSADVYSLGAMLYCLVSGRPPFQAATAVETLIQVVEQDPVAPRQINPGVCKDIETICLKCLEKEPQRRYVSAAALADDLDRWLAGRPIVARPVTRRERLSKWIRRNRVVAGLLAAVAISLVGGAIIAALFAVEARKQADLAEERERKAVAEKTIADVERRRAESARARAEFQALRAETARYAIQMDLAARAWERHEIIRAQRAIDRLPRQFRNAWEARHLQSLCRRKAMFVMPTRGDAGRVTAVAFHPGGQRLVSAAANQPVKVWDARTGAEIVRVDHIAWSVAVSPDGKKIVTGGADHKVKIWDAQSGRPILVLSGHQGPVRGIAFNPDGSRLVTGSLDKTVRIWNTTTGQEIATLRGHTLGVLDVAFGPFGKRIASAGSDGSVVVWNVETARPTLTLLGHSGLVSAVQFGPAGRWIVTGSADKTVRVWDAQTGREASRFESQTSAVTGVRWRSDGLQILSAGQDGTISAWDVVSGQVAFTLKGHTDSVTCVAYSPDGRRIVSGSRDRTIKVWNPKTQHATRVLSGHTKHVTSVAFDRDGNRVASGSWDASVRIWNSDSGEQILRLDGHNGPVNGVRFSRNGRRLVTGSQDTTCKVWDASTGKCIKTLAGHAGSVFSVDFGPDGRRVVSGGTDTIIRIWDAQTGRLIRTLRGHRDRVSSVCYSFDGKWIVSGSDDRDVRLWDAETGRPIRTFAGHTGPVTAVAIRRDGGQIASASHDTTVRVWDVESGATVQTLSGHANWATTVAFDPSGRRLVSAGGEFDEPADIRIWDVKTGQQVFRLRGHTDVVYCVAFSPDGRRIASGSEDRTVRIWEAAANTVPPPNR